MTRTMNQDAAAVCSHCRLHSLQHHHHLHLPSASPAPHYSSHSPTSPRASEASPTSYSFFFSMPGPHQLVSSFCWVLEGCNEQSLYSTINLLIVPPSQNKYMYCRPCSRLLFTLCERPKPMYDTPRATCYRFSVGVCITD